VTWEDITLTHNSVKLSSSSNFAFSFAQTQLNTLGKDKLFLSDTSPCPLPGTAKQTHVFHNSSDPNNNGVTNNAEQVVNSDDQTAGTIYHTCLNSLGEGTRIYTLKEKVLAYSGDMAAPTSALVPGVVTTVSFAWTGIDWADNLAAASIIFAHSSVLCSACTAKSTTCSSVAAFTSQVSTENFDFENANVGNYRACITTGGSSFSIPDWTLYIGACVTVEPAVTPAITNQKVTVTGVNFNLDTTFDIFFSTESNNCNLLDLNGRTFQRKWDSNGIAGFDFKTMVNGNPFTVPDKLITCFIKDLKTGAFCGDGIVIESFNSAVALGDPHIRGTDGKFVDFFGPAGVYDLYTGGELKAHGKFDLATREDLLIWHPKVMRAGMMIEEVTVSVFGVDSTIRLGVHGGGLVSVTGGAHVKFLTTMDHESFELGSVTLAWEPCVKDCSVHMPWGTHVRVHSLEVRGQAETLRLHITHSSGYTFIDAELDALTSLKRKSSGILAQAAFNPHETHAMLLSNQEASLLV
jgi:hypothetical protein